MSSVWRFLLVAGSIPALLAPLAPGILHGLTPAFPGKWAITLGLTLALAGGFNSLSTSPKCLGDSRAPRQPAS
jgi:hypothetical protein